MKRSEIARKFDEMVAFAEVEKFIDTAVKHYSSGMFLRLAFAVAAHLEPDILLVDEVLAVGDIAFQKKCIGKMGEVAHAGRTILFVSHNMSAIKELCTRGILLEAGRDAFDGSSTQCISEYMRRLESRPVVSQGCARALSVGAIRVTGQSGSGVASGEPFRVSLPLIARNVRNPWMFFIVEDFTGRTLIHSRISSNDLDLNIIDGKYTLDLAIPPLWLSPGVYSAFFKFINPSAVSGSGRVDSERLMLEIGGEFDQSGKAILNPAIGWTINSEVEQPALLHSELSLNATSL
jgi:lipopolysaccharide transport system ATP-binding protein